jgi:hypothetical protein
MAEFTPDKQETRILKTTARGPSLVDNAKATETLQAGHVVCVDDGATPDSDGMPKAKKANSSALATSGVLGIAIGGGDPKMHDTADIPDNSSFDYIFSGSMTGYTGLSAGTIYYVGRTAGTIAELSDLQAGDQIVIVGVGLSSTDLFVNICITGQTVPAP